jgi:hypothetical protein
MFRAINTGILHDTPVLYFMTHLSAWHMFDQKYWRIMCPLTVDTSYGSNF